MSEVIQFTNRWLLHVRSCRPCESWWIGEGGEQCGQGRVIRDQLDQALERGMPVEEPIFGE